MDDRARAIRTARQWLKADPLFLDTETTGLDDYAEICEIAVLDATGKILMDTLVRPINLIPPETTSIHGITDWLVARAPEFPEVLPQLQAIVKGRTVLIYNLKYDWRLLWQSADAYAIEDLGLNDDHWHCAMNLYAQFYGEWSEEDQALKWLKLEDAALQCGLKLPGDLHRARADAELNRQVILHIALSK